ncbi:chemotaxis protein CheD [Calderihabitans maritimus]|uniref:chemotaxis protein CheD n=1 Tax=Calderihabitans maritimus TaxID=1246530 RepID=UPI001864F846
MFNLELKVGIAELKVARSPTLLVTIGLGSCIGVALWDRLAKVGGLAHIMLPDSKQFSQVVNKAKFADLAIPLLVKKLEDLGASKHRLEAKLAGGAQMFSFKDRRISVFNIGERNIQVARKVLQELGIKLVAEDVGGNYGRTMILNTANGEVYIRIVGRPQKTI